MEEGLQQLKRAYASAVRLVLYRGIQTDPAVKAWLELISAILGGTGTPPGLSREALAQAYARFFSTLGEKTREGSHGQVGTPWQNHLLDLILNDDNLFARHAEETSLEELGPSLTEQAKLDLSRLQQIHDLDSRVLLEAVEQVTGETDWVGWDQLNGSSSFKPLADSPRLRLKQELHCSGDWGLKLQSLAQFHKQSGAGIFCQFRAFHWKHAASGNRLEGIPEPDPIQLEDLIGCDHQKHWLLQNTRFFLDNHPANNVLVYGDRGTGKSSSIKSLIHHFSKERLRMVEVSRDDLHDLPEVMNILRHHGGRFIVFIDDLSFEEGETQYKTLKAVLEGSLEARPGNVLIYATSNRRHLIREYFSDRNSMNEEVRHQDTLQEKVSLADRFGIQLVFVAPDQAQYLEIVRSMAFRRGIQLPPQELDQNALQWAQLHNGCSGRTARQFMDFLEGELGRGNRARLQDAGESGP